MSRIAHEHPRFRVALMTLVLVALAAAPVLAADRSAEPAADRHAVTPLADVPMFRADFVDHTMAKLEDRQSEGLGQPPRFAIPQETFISPKTHGAWERISEDTMLWRLRIESPGALSLNLGFTLYDMPEGGRLLIYPADGSAEAIAFTAADNKAHGELWTPLVETDVLVVEVGVPVKAADRLNLLLTSVNTGYRKFGDLFPEKSGTCNIDVVCPEGDNWREEIQTVAVYQRNGAWACTGVMVNNTNEDETPYFLTADHCGLNATSDATIVLYWNFNSPTCGQQGGGSLSQTQTGSTFVTGGSTSDYTLIELDTPPDPAWNVAYAGWDNSGVNPTSAVAIHHPGTDEKSISFENDPVTTATYLGDASPGNSTHFRVADWDLGTTEGGSSGSPLFDQNHRVVGQLHGGYAACGNDLADWYGKLSISWAGLSAYLDPSGTGATTLDLFAPYLTGMRVSSGNYDMGGNEGGPFLPATFDYVLNNNGTTSLDYQVTFDEAWADITNATGTIAPGGEATVTISPNAATDALAIGSYHGTLSFENLTSHDGDATRAVNLQVGVPQVVVSFNMDSDPGWTTEGDWAWGQPQGGGGQYGNNDPTTGFTGTNVVGYNLAGDYGNSLPERHLTTTAIDCSSLEAVTLKFQRWLNVEQPTYDHAYLRISTDGINYTTLWENGAVVEDNAWSLQSFDISAIADGEATVYLRWTQGTTDGSWQYSGWNIDDVEIWALQQAVVSDASGPNRRVATLMPNVPNPFNPMTVVAFELKAPARATLAVFDLRGRHVRTLRDEHLDAGRYEATWDGTDAAGTEMPSGSYVFRLTAGGVTQVHKALLVR
jgi:lysyl endopeptidase